MTREQRILVTGAAGFIGFHLTKHLLKDGHRIVGLDSLNDYYDVQLKEDRLLQLQGESSFEFVKLDLADRAGMETLFKDSKFDSVVHLAAQAGVRYSIDNPYAYVDANLVGFAHVLEGCRHTQVKHLVYASSSSVYGANKQVPFSTHHNVDHPVSLYAATKKANELMAHTYAHLYGLPVTGLRFFTVYGPWGRPDMAYFLFTKAILEGRPIDVFNNGLMQRDFTYVDDIVEGIVRVLYRIPEAGPRGDGAAPETSNSTAPYRVYNIGNSKPVDLMHFISVLEKELGHKARINMLPMQPGDVPITCADVEDLMREFDFKPVTSVEEGIKEFAAWYREYYSITQSATTV